MKSPYPGEVVFTVMTYGASPSCGFTPWCGSRLLQTDCDFGAPEEYDHTQHIFDNKKIIERNVFISVCYLTLWKSEADLLVFFKKRKTSSRGHYKCTWQAPIYSFLWNHVSYTFYIYILIKTSKLLPCYILF